MVGTAVSVGGKPVGVSVGTAAALVGVGEAGCVVGENIGKLQANIRLMDAIKATILRVRITLSFE
jgi:hypothetical protein